MANPMYRQIAEDLRAQIEGGDLEPGQQLRTEIELREHYGASRNTVRDAIKLLTAVPRIVEEIWHDEPTATWEKAKKLLADGYSRHEVLHRLAG